MKKQFIIHSFLFGIFPLLFLYNYNIGQITLRQLLPPALAIILIIFVLLFLLNFILKNKNKSKLIVSLAVVLFFSYGYFYQVDSTWIFNLASLAIGINKITWLLWVLILLVASYFIIRAKRNFNDLNKIINVMAIALIVLSLFNIIKHQISNNNSSSPSNSQNNISTGDRIRPNKLPDIYYIIFDEYAGVNTLNHLFDYDNTDFLNNLEAKGFYVARDSHSNYMQTYLSLASSLNMEYINYLSDELGENSTDWGPVHDKVRKSQVWRLLKEEGYHFYNFRSGYGPSNFFQNYELNFQASNFGLDEFSMTLLQTTLARPFIENSYKDDKRERVLYTFEKLTDLADNDLPLFVFAHIVSPHSPYVFGPNGEEILEDCDEKNEDGSWSDFRKQCYIDEITFINKEIEKVVDEILLKSKSEAIIIIQADHGSKTDGYAKDLTDEFKKERSEILNVYHLPDGVGNELYDSISPVNTFRFILNHYFGYDYDILLDKSYYSSQAKPFKFIDVTKETSWDISE